MDTITNFIEFITTLVISNDVFQQFLDQSYNQIDAIK